MAACPLSVLSSGVTSDAIPVILLHGFASSGSNDFLTGGWPESLAEAGRSSHVVDLPGHGDSPAVDSVTEGTTTRVVDAIAATIETLGADRVDVIAYSLGARLAWGLPRRLPGKIRRLVLGGISPFEPFAGIDLDDLRLAASGATVAANPMTGMMAGMIRAPGLDTASLVNLIGGLGSEPFTPKTSAPDVPVLFVAGTDDPMSQGIERLVSEVEGARLVHVPGDHRAALGSAEFRDAAIAFLT